ncbi:MAG TPA: tetratricopeptide repeat protein [Planctomycetes bacterium]|nr:tetratricopeptide repeat protein [Planctomycetota bacterium]HIJ70986.1 tetratricopeptide repeat protein [Planctomycetota bacterium]
MCSNLLFARLAVAVLVLSGAVFSGRSCADTWHLADNGEWKKVADDEAGKYMLDVAEVKRLISVGRVDSAQQALERLKADFPDIAGPDLDAFMEAEMLYGAGKWAKAVKKYDEFIEAWPQSPLYESALEREYAIATAFLGGEKRKVLKVLKLSAYEEGVKIMRRIADRAGDAPIAERALISVARSCEKRGSFYVADPDKTGAYEVWAEISARWPTGGLGRDAMLGMAHSLHSAYRSCKYDSSGLESARRYYEDFKERYSQLADEHNIDAKIKMVDEQLAYKQFAIGEYYERSGNRQAANLYYQMVSDDWPGTDAAAMAKAKLEATETREPSPKKERSIRRRLFDAGNTFLDSWFGLGRL